MSAPQTLPALTAMAVSLAADAGAARAVTLLEDAGIPSLVLKGASLAEWLYADDDLRVYGDADLLVGPDQHSAAEAALAAAGYAMVVRDLHASTWARPGDPVCIDLHSRLWALSSSPAVVWRVLWGRSVAQPIGGRELRVLDPGARALVVCLHHAHHQQLGQSTARTEADLTRALDLLGTEEWDAVGDLAFELSATLHLASGLRSVDDPRAAAVADHLRLPSPAALQTVIQPDGTVALMGALVSLRAAHGVRRKLSLLGRELMPAPDELRDRSALARRGGAGLALAYVLAPLWSLAQLPAAVRHLRGLR